MKIITIGNQKGGVGKSTTVRNLAHHLGLLGKKVLMIDCDPQASLTEMCGISDTQQVGIKEVMEGSGTMRDVIVQLSDNVSLVSSDIALSKSLLILHQMMYGREMVLRNAIAAIAPDSFDFILIDCSPCTDTDITAHCVSTWRDALFRHCRRGASWSEPSTKNRWCHHQ